MLGRPLSRQGGKMTIYKYIENKKYLFDILKRNELFFNSFRNYKDLCEVLTFIHDTNDNKDYIVQDYKNKIKACSFSQTKREYLLWTHCAKNHQGFCIEFEFDNIVTVSEIKNVNKIILDNNDIYIFPIQYEGPYQVTVDINRPDKKFSLSETIDIVSHKYKYWNYEKEYRMITFSKKPCRISFPKEAIKGITSGALVSNKEVSNINKKIKIMGYNISTERLVLEPNLGILI